MNEFDVVPEDKKVPKFQTTKYLTRDKNSCINMLSSSQTYHIRRRTPEGISTGIK